MEEDLRKAKDELELRIQKRTHELEYERQLLQTIIDNIPVMLALHTRNREIPVLNKEIERLTGWSQNDLEYTDLMSELYPDPEYRREIWEYMVNPGNVWKDIRMRTRDGHILETRW